MSTKNAKGIVILEKLKLVESEIFRIGAKHGVKTVDELDKLIEKGKLSEKGLGEDLFVLDHLLSERSKLEKELNKLSIKKSQVWKNLPNLLGLQKQSFLTS